MTYPEVWQPLEPQSPSVVRMWKVPADGGDVSVQLLVLPVPHNYLADPAEMIGASARGEAGTLPPDAIFIDGIQVQVEFKLAALVEFKQVPMDSAPSRVKYGISAKMLTQGVVLQFVMLVTTASGDDRATSNLLDTHREEFRATLDTFLFNWRYVSEAGGGPPLPDEP